MRQTPPKSSSGKLRGITRRKRGAFRRAARCYASHQESVPARRLTECGRPACADPGDPIGHDSSSSILLSGEELRLGILTASAARGAESKCCDHRWMNRSSHEHSEILNSPIPLFINYLQAGGQPSHPFSRTPVCHPMHRGEVTPPVRLLKKTAR